MRHQTTAYDSMVIPRVKGKRREVRRMLAQRSKELLARYRRVEFGCRPRDRRSFRALRLPTTLELVRSLIVKDPCAVQRVRGDHLNLIHGVLLFYSCPSFSFRST